MSTDLETIVEQWIAAFNEHAVEKLLVRYHHREESAFQEVVIRYQRKADGEADKEVFEYFKIENNLITESRVLRGFVY